MKIRQQKRKRNKVNEHQLIKTPEKKVHILNVNHNLAELKTNDGLSNGMYM